MFTAQDTLKKGLIDSIGYPEDGIAWAKQMAGVEKAKVVMYHRPYEYMPNLYSTEVKGGHEVGMLINVELPDWLNGAGTQFLYLWQPGMGR